LGGMNVNLTGFALQAMDTIPADYTVDQYWP
jgi:hypothetical protein